MILNAFLRSSERVAQGRCIFCILFRKRKPRPEASEPGHFFIRVRTGSSLVLDELAGLQLLHGLIQLGLGVHHDGAIPRDWLLERLA